MSCRRNISALVWLCRTIEVKLEAVFLHAIDVIEGDGDRLARKGLNAFGNGTRGLGGVDDGRGETNDGGYAYDDGNHGYGSQQAESGAREQHGGDANRKYGGNRCGDVGSGSPQHAVIDRNRGCGKSSEDQQSAENSVSGGEQRRKLLFFHRAIFTAAGGKIFADQECPGRDGGQNIARQLGLRSAEKQDGQKHPDEKK